MRCRAKHGMPGGVCVCVCGWSCGRASASTSAFLRKRQCSVPHPGGGSGPVASAHHLQLHSCPHWRHTARLSSRSATRMAVVPGLYSLKASGWCAAGLQRSGQASRQTVASRRHAAAEQAEARPSGRFNHIPQGAGNVVQTRPGLVLSFAAVQHKLTLLVCIRMQLHQWGQST